MQDGSMTDWRELVQYRGILVRDRGRVQGYIRKILEQASAVVPGEEFTPEYNAGLRDLGEWRIAGHLVIVEMLDEQIRRTDAPMAEAFRENPDAQILATIPGVDEFAAMVMASEIGDVNRFPDPHKLVSYIGLAPGAGRGRAGRTDSTTSRWVLIEAIPAHVRLAGDSAVTKFYNNMAQKKGEEKAKVAAAAKMLRIIFWMLKNGTGFTECMEAEARRMEERDKAWREKNARDDPACHAAEDPRQETAGAARIT